MAIISIEKLLIQGVDRPKVVSLKVVPALKKYSSFPIVR